MSINQTINPSVQEAFDEIFNHHKELQNWSSSSWWFFLLLPEQNKAYGPKQMMFTFASRIGELVGVGNKWQKGMKLDRPNKKKDYYPTTVAGWINDGSTVHKNIVFENANAELSSEDKYNKAWNGEFGGEIVKSQSHHIGLDCYYNGQNGFAKFSIWANDLKNELEVPQIVSVMGPKQGKLGNVHSIAWRKFKFEGEFKCPTGTEKLTGYGYFQRVLMNIPLQSWMWNYLIFQDGSVFSSFMMYIGPNSFKRKFNFFRQTIERLRYNIKPSAYFYDNQKKELLYFEDAQIVPKLTSGDPEFYVEATTTNGDIIRIKNVVHNKTSFSLKRRVLSMFWETRYMWTEYMTKVEKINGIINGSIINEDYLGQGFGNVEYSFGMSL